MGILLTSTGTSATSSGIFWVIYIVAIFGFIYFFFMRPQKKEQKQKAALLSSLAVGDSVRTTGGFIGTVIDINDDMVSVEFGNNRNCRIPMVREAIVEIEKPEDAVKPVETKADNKKDKEKKTK